MSGEVELRQEDSADQIENGDSVIAKDLTVEDGSKGLAQVDPMIDLEDCVCFRVELLWGYCLHPVTALLIDSLNVWVATIIALGEDPDSETHLPIVIVCSTSIVLLFLYEALKSRWIGGPDVYEGINPTGVDLKYHSASFNVELYCIFYGLQCYFFMWIIVTAGASSEWATIAWLMKDPISAVGRFFIGLFGTCAAYYTIKQELCYRCEPLCNEDDPANRLKRKVAPFLDGLGRLKGLVQTSVDKEMVGIDLFHLGYDTVWLAPDLIPKEDSWCGLKYYLFVKLSTFLGIDYETVKKNYEDRGEVKPRAGSSYDQVMLDEVNAPKEVYCCGIKIELEEDKEKSKEQHK